MNFFAILKGDAGIARLALAEEIRQQLKQEFKRQEDALFASDPDEVAFDPGHRPDEAEISFIEDWEVPEQLARCAHAPLEHQTLTLQTDTTDKISGVFGAEVVGGKPYLFFQTFDRRRVLGGTGFGLLFSNGTFRKLSDPGIVLDRKLVALYRDKRLYFQSYFMARRVLDLSGYYREATNEDLVEFAKLERVDLETPTTLSDNADEWVRRKVAMLRDSNVLNKVPPKKIADEAEAYGLTISVTAKRGKDAIQFPEDKPALKKLLRFLDESYYTSPLSGEKFVANSKRRL